jgi:hypothetical protein
MSVIENSGGLLWVERGSSCGRSIYQASNGAIFRVRPISVARLGHKSDIRVSASDWLPVAHRQG